MNRALIGIAIVLSAAATLAQSPCPTGKELQKIPEIVSDGHGHLKATIIVTAEQQQINTRNPISAPTPTSVDNCYPQLVRAMRGENANPPYPPYDPNKPADPLPGPTLRAHVGDLVELTFLNQVDMNKFPKSLDQGQCDSVTGIYPESVTQVAKGKDIFPNCFHGSTTANMHFHGMHTNPNTTGDNVFVEIRPSLRTRDEANKPLVTEATVKQDFDEFFKR